MRFIPAFAGNTGDDAIIASYSPVHPRVRGEHPTFDVAKLEQLGSSPRSRGTRRVRDGLVDVRRFIPAFAGNTDTSRGLRLDCSVHPRVRGEHIGAPWLRVDNYGSSPRSRGTPSRRTRCSSRHRFIPAFAGNTSFTQVLNGPKPVHPRVRGEHASGKTVMNTSNGSSPRSRGTRGRADPKTPGEPVHPRVRGEHRDPQLYDRSRAGSSPRSRGTRRWAAAKPATRRFIPAFAGNTLDLERAVSQTRVHPRVRGEHTLS